MTTPPTHPIRNGIIIAVTSAAILYVAKFIPGLYRWVFDFFAGIVRLLGESMSAPRWVLLLLCLFCLPTLIFLLQPLLRRGPRQPSITDYQTDRFFDVVWRWHYSYYGQPQNLWCFCPVCDTQLVYTEDRCPDRVRFTCEHCHRPIHETNGDKEYALAQVYRQIDRKLRSGEWKNAITQSA